MDVKDAYKVLSDNFFATNNSFLMNAHELSSFDIDSYWEYYDCLITLGKNNCIDAMEKVIDTYICIQTLFISHYNEKDLYTLLNIPNTVNEYIENLNFAFKAFFVHDYSSERYFGKHSM